MPNVKIFVSHRIDLESDTIENDVYMPVRCGAVFDKREINIPGDNTGENISQYRDYLGEITVQYWAWKNIDADYYGICHYRRYLSFADKRFETDEKNQIVEEHFCDATKRKYQLDDPEYIKQFVSEYDAVVTEYADVSKMFTPRGLKKTVREHFEANHHYLIEKDSIDLFLSTLKQLYPEYHKSAVEYFAGSKFRGFNCFVMKKELFFELCEMEIALLKKMQESGQINFENYTSFEGRTYGFFCEWMAGIYTYHLEKQKKYRIKQVQLVFFNKTEKSRELEAKDGYVPVAFFSNHHYIRVLPTIIKSLQNSKKKETKYDILIFQEDLTREERSFVLHDFKNSPDMSIRFVDFRRKGLELCDAYGICKCNPMNFVTLLPWMLPQYNKILFLHVDIQITGDLMELYGASLGECCIGAGRDYNRIAQGRDKSDIEEFRNIKLLMESPLEYFSTAVMLMDLTKMRQEISLGKSIQNVLGNQTYQDVLNKLYYGKVKRLELGLVKEDCIDEYGEFLTNFLPAKLLDEMKCCTATAVVVHYPLGIKPWMTPDAPKAIPFWTTARSTSSYEMLLHNSILNACLHVVGNSNGVQSRFSLLEFAKRCAPLGSRRREIVKKIIPKGSRRWNFLKKIYHSFA